MSEQLTLRSALDIVRKRWLTIVATVAVLVALVTGWSVSQPNRYESTVVLLAGQSQGIADINSVLQVNQIAQSLGTLVTSRVVVEEAAENVGYDGSIESLLANVSVDVPANTQTIRLTVTDTNPVRAADIANAIAARFSALIDEKASDTSALTAVVWQPAIRASAPSGPQTIRNALLALVLGLVFGLGLAFMRESLDARWRSEADVERALGVAVLGGIPDIRGRRGRREAYG